MVRITLSQAVAGFILDKQAERLSPRTLEDYQNSYNKLAAFLAADLPLDQITTDHVRDFMVELATTPRPPAGVAPRPPRILSKKSQLNVHVALSSLWTWAVEQGLIAHHVVRDVPRPRPEKRAVQPFSLADVRALLAACEHTGDYTRPGKVACHNTRPTVLRDRAIILLLLDTGMRASELCGLAIADLDLKNRQARVFGKGDKERILHFSPATGRALWRYLTLARPAVAGTPHVGAPLVGVLPPTSPAFLTAAGDPYNRIALLNLIDRLGQRAGVPNCHPHRFRHTFAIQFLRNNSNIYALQAALGHSSLDMVRDYLAIVQADLATAHETASPVANWRLT